jgi:hypothetical protein
MDTRLAYGISYKGRPMTKSCSSCKYYKPDYEGSTQGLCRRFPPVLVPAHPLRIAIEDPNIETQWPEVNQEDWCGEYVRGEGP